MSYHVHVFYIHNDSKFYDSSPNHFILKVVLTVHTELTVRKIVEIVTTLVSAPILMEHA